MKIQEILLPAGIRDNSISAKTIEKIGFLQKRMSAYADKICDPGTSSRAKDFLKSKLKTDYDDLKSTIAHITEEAEPEKSPTQYEVYDRRTGKRAGGPYSSLPRARRAVDRLDNAYGGYRYSHRPIKQLTEAIHKLPLSNDDFELVKELMNRPIPAAIASIYIQDIIDDDEFNDQLNSLGETKPNQDVRPLVVEWVRRVMPDQMYRFVGGQTADQRLGILSPIHGYDSQSFRGTNNPVTGNAFGRR